MGEARKTRYRFEPRFYETVGRGAIELPALESRLDSSLDSGGRVLRNLLLIRINARTRKWQFPLRASLMQQDHLTGKTGLFHSRQVRLRATWIRFLNIEEEERSEFLVGIFYRIENDSY